MTAQRECWRCRRRSPRGRAADGDSAAIQNSTLVWLLFEREPVQLSDRMGIRCARQKPRATLADSGRRDSSSGAARLSEMTMNTQEQLGLGLLVYYSMACNPECLMGTKLVGDQCVSLQRDGGPAGTGVSAAGSEATSVSATVVAGGSPTEHNGGPFGMNATVAISTAGNTAGVSGSTSSAAVAAAVANGAGAAAVGGGTMNPGAAQAGAAGSATGMQTADCQPGAVSCDDLSVEQCTAGSWTKEPECPFVCSAGMCTGTCKPGEKRCADNVPQICDASANLVASGAACPNVCSMGECTGSCVPGSKQCSGASVQTCTAAGVWQSGENCPFVCSDGNCTGECMPNAVRCSGLTREVCDDKGHWKSGSTCPYVCTNGMCTGQCMPKTTSCSGNNVQTCSDQGKWQPGTSCQYVCSDGKCAGECAPDQMRCSGLSVQSCDEHGAWQSKSTCPYLCDSATGACTGECKPGSPPRCSPTDPTRQQTCSSSGHWTTGDITPPCADCSPGETQCDYTTHKQKSCESGHWIPGAISMECGAVCTPGQTGCGVMGQDARGPCWNCSFHGLVPGQFVVSYTCDPSGMPASGDICSNTCGCDTVDGHGGCTTTDYCTR